MTKGTYRILTGATLIALVGVLLWLHLLTPGDWRGIVIWSAALALSVIGAAEVARMEGYREHGLLPALALAAVVVGGVTWLYRAELASPRMPWLVWVAGAVLATSVAAAVSPRSRGKAAGFALWATVPLFGLLAVDRTWGIGGLAVLILLSKVGDVFGYFVGKAIGRRRPFPVLSPNKTVAGCVASLVAGTGTGVLLGALGGLPNQAGPVAGAIVGLILNLVAQAADLFESKVKRLGRVKDSGTLCAAAGGVLDVVDSLLFTVPVALLLWPLLF